MRADLTGAEELHAGFMTIEQANTWCSTHRERCHGFMCHAPRAGDAPSAVLYVTLVGEGAQLVYHPNFYAWRRAGAAVGDASAASKGNKEEL